MQLINVIGQKGAVDALQLAATAVELAQTNLADREREVTGANKRLPGEKQYPNDPHGRRMWDMMRERREAMTAFQAELLKEAQETLAIAIEQLSAQVEQFRAVANSVEDAEAAKRAKLNVLACDALRIAADEALGESIKKLEKPSVLTDSRIKTWFAGNRRAFTVRVKNGDSWVYYGADGKPLPAQPSVPAMTEAESEDLVYVLGEKFGDEAGRAYEVQNFDLEAGRPGRVGASRHFNKG